MRCARLLKASSPRPGRRISAAATWPTPANCPRSRRGPALRRAHPRPSEPGLLMNGPPPAPKTTFPGSPPARRNLPAHPGRLAGTSGPPPNGARQAPRSSAKPARLTDRLPARQSAPVAGPRSNETTDPRNHRRDSPQALPERRGSALAARFPQNPHGRSPKAVQSHPTGALRHRVLPRLRSAKASEIKSLPACRSIPSTPSIRPQADQVPADSTPTARDPPGLDLTAPDRARPERTTPTDPAPRGRLAAKAAWRAPSPPAAASPAPAAQGQAASRANLTSLPAAPPASAPNPALAGSPNPTSAAKLPGHVPAASGQAPQKASGPNCTVPWVPILGSATTQGAPCPIRCGGWDMGEHEPPTATNKITGPRT